MLTAEDFCVFSEIRPTFKECRKRRKGFEKVVRWQLALAAAVGPSAYSSLIYKLCSGNPEVIHCFTVQTWRLTDSLLAKTSEKHRLRRPAVGDDNIPALEDPQFGTVVQAKAKSAISQTPKSGRSSQLCVVPLHHSTSDHWNNRSKSSKSSKTSKTSKIWQKSDVEERGFLKATSDLDVLHRNQGSNSHCSRDFGRTVELRTKSPIGCQSSATLLSGFPAEPTIVSLVLMENHGVALTKIAEPSAFQNSAVVGREPLLHKPHAFPSKHCYCCLSVREPSRRATI